MHRTSVKRILIPVLIGLAVLLAVPALAGSLADARGAGHVGERLDGYVGIVIASPGADLSALVADINARRHAQYVQIAQQNGSTVQAVAALAGLKLIERAQPGEFIQSQGGHWVQKP